MLKHKTAKNHKVVTQFGEITFDAKGESKDLKAEEEKFLAERIEAYEFVEEKKAPAKKAPAKKTAPAKKATATKKEEPKEDVTKDKK